MTPTLEALDIQERRRLDGIPTVSMIVAPAEYAAVAAAHAWVSGRKLALVTASGDLRECAKRWLFGTSVAADPLLLAAIPIARGLRTSPDAILNRLRDDAAKVLPSEFRQLLPNDPAIAAIISSLTAHGSIQRFWDLLCREVDRREVEYPSLLAACIKLLDPDRGPALIFSQIDAETLAQTAIIATSLVEACPQLRVFVTTNELTYKNGLRDRSAHAADLLRESVVHISDSLASAAPRVAAMLEEVRQLRDHASKAATKDGTDAAFRDAARSAAERTLFAALEAHTMTRGRFELNGKLNTFFGNRRAEIDLLARAEFIAIEVDGYHHFVDAGGYRRDRRKDILLQNEGYFVIRALADDIVDRLDEIMETIVAIVAARLRSEV